jgi:putative ABC transport system permease protein
MALSGLRARWVRSLLLCGSITLCVGIVTVVFAFREHINELVRGLDEPLLVVAPISNVLPFAYIQTLKSMPSVEPVEWSRTLRATDGARLRYNVNGANEALVDIMPKAWLSASAETIAKWRAERTGAMVSARLLREIGWKVGQQVTLQLVDNPAVPVLVVGPFEGSSPNGVYMHYEYLDEMMAANARGSVNTIVARYAKGALAETAKRIDDAFANSSAPTFSTPSDSWAEAIVNAASAVPNLITQIGALLFLVTLLVTATTLAILARERRSELAVLRAIGFRRSRVVRLLILEAIALCIPAGVLGGLVPFLLFHERGLNVARFMTDVRVSPIVAALGLSSALLLGIVAAIVPAVLEVRHRIADAMEA